MAEGGTPTEELPIEIAPQKQRIPQKSITRRSLKQLFRNRLQNSEAQRQEAEKGRLIAEENSRIDGLTNLPNKSWFEDELTRRHADAQRQNRSLWVLYIDADLFKEVNDKHGHPKGDDVLKIFGELGARVETPLARIGGEEFGQIIEDGLDIKNVQRIVSRYSINFGDKTEDMLGERKTLSFGLVRMGEEDTTGTLKEKADKALYNSKHTGRNKATLFSGGSIEEPIFSPIELLSKEDLGKPA